MQSPNTTMADAIRQVTESRRDQEALVCGEVRATYGHMLEHIVALARGLHSLGIGKGDKVVALLPPGPDFVTLFFAVASLGAVIVPLNPQLRRRGLSGVIQDAEPVALVTARPLEAGLLQQLCGPEELKTTANRFAEEIAAKTSAVSVALARQMLWRMQGAAHPMQAHLVESRAIYATGRSSDAREGITSFLEKRQARFSDKPSTDLPDVFPGEQELWWK